MKLINSKITNSKKKRKIYLDNWTIGDYENSFDRENQRSHISGEFFVEYYNHAPQRTEEKKDEF